MFKISIVSKDNFAVLGINGVSSFFEAFGTTELDTVQIVDNQFVETIKKMETFEFGFTTKFKEKFLKVINDAFGQKILLVDKWLVSIEDADSQFCMDVVKKLNQGLSFEDANKQTQVEWKI